MSTVLTDTIKGKTTAANLTIGSTPIVSSSANSMTIRGEGSNQTSIQQGLAKAWANSSGGGTPVVDDSFNNASITDNGTADDTFTFTNNMNNANYSCCVATLEGSFIALVQLLAQNTSNINPKSHTPSTSADVTGKNYSVNGDLA